MNRKVVKYRPPGKVSTAFHASNAPVRYLQGPVGSGKSTCCVMEIFTRSREQKPDPDGVRKTRWAIIRNSYPILKSTTINTWLDWVLEVAFGPVKYDSPISHHLQYTLPDGTSVDCDVLFLSLDTGSDSKKLLSLELTGAWINEGKEIRRDVFDLVQTRVGRYPAVRDGGATWSGVIVDSNPPATDHWIYRLFVKQKPKSWDFFKQPSGRSEAAENTENLPVGYYDRLIEGHDDEWIKAYVDGDFAFVTDGRPVHPTFTYSTHVTDQPIKPAQLETIVGIDFGLTPAAVILQREVSGRLICTDEITTNEAGGIGAANFARELNKLIQSRYRECPVLIYGDPAGTQRAQTDERTIFDVLRANGVDASPAPSNDVDMRLETVNRLLETLTMDGKPSIMFSPSCEGIISALAGGYRFKRVQISGDERFHDKPEKNAHSHIADSLQYALLGGGEGAKTVGGAGAGPYADWSVPINGGATVTNSRRRRDGWNRPIN